MRFRERACALEREHAAASAPFVTSLDTNGISGRRARSLGAWQLVREAGVRGGGVAVAAAVLASTCVCGLELLVYEALSY